MDVSFSPDKNYFAIFQRNRISIYRVADFFDQTVKKQKYEMYYGYNKQSIGFSDNWNQAAFSDGEVTTLIFKQDYICDRENFIKKVKSCDEVYQQYLENSEQKGIAYFMEVIDAYFAKKE